MTLHEILRTRARSDIEQLAATLPAPRVIRSLDGVSPYLSRYYLSGRPTMPDGSEPFDAQGEVRDGIVYPPGAHVYLHCFHRGDNERELHCHPWLWSMSLILVGGYREQRRVVAEFAGKKTMWDVEERLVQPGDVNYIAQSDFHRVDLIDGECWTVFVSGPKASSWGFWDRATDSYTPWREFMKRAAAPVSP